MLPSTLRRVINSNVVSSNSAASTASVFVGITGNLIEDVKVANCYFQHWGLEPSRDPSQPLLDWRTRPVPELEDAYPDLNRFGQTSSHVFSFAT